VKVTEIAARMNASNYLLDTYVAQGFSRLTECRAQPIGSDYPHHTSWLSQFTLNTTLAGSLAPDRRALALSILPRAMAAIDDFDEACSTLSEFISGGRKIHSYFRALRRFESAIAQLYQALDIVRTALGTKFFERGDGTPCQRLNTIYNESRHHQPELLSSGQVLVVVLENEGLRAPTAVVTFDELRALVGDLAGLADSIAACRFPKSKV
jgi:hypothetical protein